MTTQTYEQLLAAAPPAPDTTGLRARIAASTIAAGRRVVVLDDDPTGSQSVHGVEVVLALDGADYRRTLAEPGSTTFLLTNTRSMSEDDAGALNERLGTELARIAGPERLTFISRSDSTLRGHLRVEVAALERAVRSVNGRGFDAVLVAPSYLEAGRSTVGDVHWARVEGRMLPVADTEFARDATFGFRSSNLREWIAETTGGSVRRDDVWSLDLHDIRVGGPDRVHQVLREARDGRHIVVNAAEYADLDIVAAGLLMAQEDGDSILVRSAPSMVKSVAGIPDRDPVRPDEIRSEAGTGRSGLIVVGSHVGLTNRQLRTATARSDVRTVELPVPELIDGGVRDAVARVSTQLRDGLRDGHVLLHTSRTVRRGSDADASLAIARLVSTALSEVVASVRQLPAWVIAKGGITSHDVAVRGMGIRRAVVLGQLLPGAVSVLRPTEVEPGASRVPYVVFAGNVGDEHTLTHAIDVLSATPR